MLQKISHELHAALQQTDEDDVLFAFVILLDLSCEASRSLPDLFFRYQYFLQILMHDVPP